MIIETCVTNRRKESTAEVSYLYAFGTPDLMAWLTTILGEFQRIDKVSIRKYRPQSKFITVIAARKITCTAGRLTW